MANRTLRTAAPPALRRAASQVASLAPGGLFSGPLSDAQLEAALEQLYVQNADGSHDLLVPHRGRISRVPIRATRQAVFDAHWPHFKLAPPVVESSAEEQVKGDERRRVEARKVREEGGQAAAAAKKVGVNKEFFRQLR